MAVRTRPGFQVSVERTLKNTTRKSVFLDLKPGTTNLRFLPPDNPEGNLFFESAQHFRLKEEGEKRAFACLRMHGDEGQECPACVLIERAIAEDAEKYAKLIDTFGGIGVASKWHAQVVPLPTEGTAVDQLYIVGLSKTTAGKISNVLKMERDNRQPLITDPDNGQAVAIVHNGKSGKMIRYEVQATGLRIPLDEIYPQWVDEFLNIEKAIGMRVVPPQRLAKSLQETYPAAFSKLMSDFKFDDEAGE